jgi:ABC-type branched-subunit amino acid transport system ATPase component
MALRAERITVHYGGVTAADDVSFTVERGEIVGLIGPNGSGKTTVLNATTGFARRTAGTIELDGEDLSRQRADAIAKRGLRRTFQAAPHFSWLTVGEHLRLAEQAASAETVDPREVSATLDLDRYVAEFPEALPYGVQRNLGLFMALAAAPTYLLLDEPTSGLHQTEVEEVRVVLEAQKAAGVGILMVDHNVPFVRSVVDRLIVLNAGAIVAAGKPQEVFETELVRSVYLGL